MKKFTFDFSVDAWIDGVEIDADSYDEAVEELRLMTLEKLVDRGHVKDFDVFDIDVEFDADEEDEDDNQEDTDSDDDEEE